MRTSWSSSDVPRFAGIEEPSTTSRLRPWRLRLILLLLTAAAPLSASAQLVTAVRGMCPGCPYNQCSACNVQIQPLFPALESCASRTHTVTGALTGTIVRGGFCGMASKTKGVTTDVGWATYGAQAGVSFILSGDLTYRYTVPFTLTFRAPGCATKDNPVRLSDVVISWEAPTLAVEQLLDFSTKLHAYLDVPLDGLGNFSLTATQYADHLRLSGEIPDPIPGWTPTFATTLDGAPFSDGRFCVPGTSVCLTLGGRAPSPAASTVTLYADGGSTDGRIEIFFDNPWTSVPTVWHGTADQVKILAALIPSPWNLPVVGLNEAGFHLYTDLDLAISRRDRASLTRVQVPTAAGTIDAATPSGETELAFSIPISYDLELRSYFDLPATFRVDFEAPHYEPDPLIDLSLGALPLTQSAIVDVILSAFSDYRCTTATGVYPSRSNVLDVRVPITVVEVSEPLPDTDGDLALDDGDNCPTIANPEQENSDSDEMGDACDPDDDNDGTEDPDDNCPGTANLVVNDDGTTTPNVLDGDGDGAGDVCDADLDGDGIDNIVDNCPATPNPVQENSDTNLGIVVSDADGDACDPDDDNDLVLDDADNCPLVPNPTQSDLDLDGIADACDSDLDGDGVPTEKSGVRFDNCPDLPNADQADFDADGVGDPCDEDVDGDSARNELDACQLTSTGAVVDASGCSLAQLCPCDSPRGVTTRWVNHGRYVSCVAHATDAFVESALITASAKDEEVASAARSVCGGKR
jgi:hypothetical protein